MWLSWFNRLLLKKSTINTSVMLIYNRVESVPLNAQISFTLLANQYNLNAWRDY